MKTLILILTGLLGCWAGAEHTTKGWRRVGIPIVLSITAYFYMGFFGLLYLLLFAPLCLGYGRFDPTDDKPSTIGLFAYKLLPTKPMLQDVLIRFTVSLLVWASLLGVAIVRGTWLMYGVLGAVYVITNILFGALIEKEGMFKLFGKDLLWEEAIIYACLGATSINLI